MTKSHSMRAHQGAATLIAAAFSATIMLLFATTAGAAIVSNVQLATAADDWA